MVGFGFLSSQNLLIKLYILFKNSFSRLIMDYYNKFWSCLHFVSLHGLPNSGCAARCFGKLCRHPEPCFVELPCSIGPAKWPFTSLWPPVCRYVLAIFMYLYFWCWFSPHSHGFVCTFAERYMSLKRYLMLSIPSSLSPPCFLLQ